MYLSKYLDIQEATRLVLLRLSLNKDAANPVIAAMREGVLKYEALVNGNWVALDADAVGYIRIVWENPYQSLRDKTRGNEFYYHEVRVLREDVDKLWPDTIPAKAGNPTKKGGRPEGDWDKVFTEAACFLLVSGVPKTQAEFISGVQLRLGDSAPGDTQMKARLGPLYRAAKAAMAEPA